MQFVAHGGYFFTSVALQENIYLYKQASDVEDQGSLPSNICAAPINRDTMIANNGVLIFSVISLGDVGMKLGCR